MLGASQVSGDAAVATERAIYHILAAVTVDEFCSGKLKSFLCSQRQLLAEVLLRRSGTRRFCLGCRFAGLLLLSLSPSSVSAWFMIASISIINSVDGVLLLISDGLNILYFLCLRKAKRIILKFYRGTRYVTQTAKFTVYLLPTDWKRGLK